MASAVATPLERRFGRIAGLTEMTSASALGSTTITLQFDLDRDVDRGGARRPGGDQRRRRRAAVEPADPPELPQGQPGRLADPDPVADLGHAAAGAGVRRREQHPRAEDLAAATASARCSSAAGSSRRCACRSTRSALAGMGLGLEDVRAALARRPPTSPRARSPSDGVSYALSANDQLLGADAYRSLIDRVRRTAPACAWATSPRSSTTSRTTGWPPGSTASAPC